MNRIERWLQKRLNNIANETETKRGKGQGKSYIITKNLERMSKDIQACRNAQECAEDYDSPDRSDLMKIYKDVLDDAQVYSNIQIRLNKATSGTFGIFEDGEINDELSKKFVDNKGFPLPWFRSFLISAEWAKFYGNELIGLGDISNDGFSSINRIPEENLVPQWEGFIFDCELGFSRSEDSGSNINFMHYDDPKVKNWCVPVGDPKDLGLLNKVMFYVIWKEVFGSWSMHADLFGQPLRIGKTQINDDTLKQNMLDMLADMTQGAYAAIDLQDEIELLQETKTDAYNIYERLIGVCDAAISKLILGGTMITDDGSSRSQSEVHERSSESIIFADKIDLQTVVNEKLIPRMKILGMLPEGDYAGMWNMDETLSTFQWSEVIEKLSNAGHNLTKEEVERRIGVELEEPVEPVEPIIPAPKEKDTEMNNVMNLYKDFIK